MTQSYRPSIDPRLLDYYSAELNYIMALALEFAADHPKIARRLGMQAGEVGDPYVGRLLQGAAFMNAHSQMRIDDEFPRLMQANQQDAAQTIKAQNTAIKGGAASLETPSPEMTRPDLVAASAAGIATTATDSTHMASQNDHAVTAGRDVSYSAGRSYHVSVRGAVSLFAYQLGMNFIAAQGPMVLQAQSGPMSLAALKDLTVSSTDGRVVITAAKEVWIGAGGSYIQINGSGIINGSPGPILEKTPKWSKQGADTQHPALPPMPQGNLNTTNLYSKSR